MSAASSLTSELRGEVLRLEDDLRARVSALPEVESAWRAEYDEARRLERTAASWEAWVDERVTLASVAWVLTTVFVRFCEDNGLVAPVWITHAGSRSREAVEAQQQFLREAARTNPDVTDREWLLQAVDYLKGLPATAGLVDETSPMWLVTPSGDAATRLLVVLAGAGRRRPAAAGPDRRGVGHPVPRGPLPGHLRGREEAVRVAADAGVRGGVHPRPDAGAGAERAPAGGLQDDRPHLRVGPLPARVRSRGCWTGGTSTHPAMDERERVQAALDAVHGVDINPFAVAIARFRLTVAALQASRDEPAGGGAGVQVPPRGG